MTWIGVKDAPLSILSCEISRAAFISLYFVSGSFQFSLARSVGNPACDEQKFIQLSILSCEISFIKLLNENFITILPFNSLLRDQRLLKPWKARIPGNLSILSCEISCQRLQIHFKDFDFQFSLARSGAMILMRVMRLLAFQLSILSCEISRCHRP